MAQLSEALAKSRDLAEELKSSSEGLQHQLTVKSEALAVAAKDVDSLKRSLGT